MMLNQYAKSGLIMSQKYICKITILLIICGLLPLSANASSRIKDIAAVEGVRENMLVGYGLVVGLNGTGDNMQNSVFTQKGLVDFLEKLGVNVQGSNLKTKNIAAVTVTANLPPFARQGSKIDIKVSAIGDAKSIKGGTLLATPLLGADGNVYAVGQGPISIAQFVPASPEVRTKNRGIETNGFVQNGAIVESEIDFNFADMTHLKFALYNPDFSTALSIVESINNNIPGNTAMAIDPGTIQIAVPSHLKNNIVQFVAQIEQLRIHTDNKSKIIIDEGTGTIVMGENVQISPIAIAQGNLVINVAQGPEPLEQFMNPLVDDDKRGTAMVAINNGTNLSDLVSGLNKLGVWPRDIINILQNIKASGALQAEIEVR